MTKSRKTRKHGIFHRISGVSARLSGFRQALPASTRFQNVAPARTALRTAYQRYPTPLRCGEFFFATPRPAWREAARGV
jgi:hypothetical protein